MSAVKKRRQELIERDLNLSQDLRLNDLNAIELRECHVRAMLLMDIQKIAQFSARVKNSPLRNFLLPEDIVIRIAAFIFLPGCQPVSDLIQRASAHRARSNCRRQHATGTRAVYYVSAGK